MQGEEARELNEAARELSRAAREISEAARAWKDVEEAIRASRDVERLRRDLAGLPESDIAQVAVEAVHQVRSTYTGAGGFDRGPITPEEAEAWARRREERREREGYRPR